MTDKRKWLIAREDGGVAYEIGDIEAEHLASFLEEKRNEFLAEIESLADDGKASALAGFEQLFAVAQETRDWISTNRTQRAKAVFDLLNVEVSDGGDGLSEAIAWTDDMDHAIRQMDHKSIGVFVELILKQDESERQAMRAGLKHAENRAMKAYIQSWLDQNFELRGTKLHPKSPQLIAEIMGERERRKQEEKGRAWIRIEDVATAAQKMVDLEWDTLRAWVREWKKLRSTGTQ